MRACFPGQNVTALGFGFAMLQTPRLPEPEAPENSNKDAADEPVPAPVKTPQPA